MFISKIAPANRRTIKALALFVVTCLATTTVYAGGWGWPSRSRTPSNASTVSMSSDDTWKTENSSTDVGFSGQKSSRMDPHNPVMQAIDDLDPTNPGNLRDYEFTFVCATAKFAPWLIQASQSGKGTPQQKNLISTTLNLLVALSGKQHETNIEESDTSDEEMDEHFNTEVFANIARSKHEFNNNHVLQTTFQAVMNYWKDLESFPLLHGIVPHNERLLQQIATTGTPAAKTVASAALSLWRTRTQVQGIHFNNERTRHYIHSASEAQISPLGNPEADKLLATIKKHIENLRSVMSALAAN